MPLVRISLREGKPEDYRRAIGSAVYHALIETANVPAGDEFQLISEHNSAGLIYDPGYLGIHRDDDVVLIQITLNEGRSVEVKQALYARIAELLAADPGIRPENVFISLVEVPKENWSFGNGEAQYV
jgi:phenylpyruvate tautomerase PptA (4-oxalocrotonate tautomerase family)